MGIHSLLLLFALGSPLGPASPEQAAERPITVRVLVLNYDPIIEAEGGKRLHEVFGWNDPRKLAEGYIADLREVSRGGVVHRIVEWRDLDEWPKKVDGFRYTDQTFLEAWRTRKGFHSPDEADYAAMLSSQRAIREVEAGRVDEVWIFGGPYFGYWESAMVGPEAFFINGGVYDRIPSKVRFAVMGFNYERGVAEMIHNLCHRTENHMKRVFGSWNQGTPQHLWDRFSAYELTSPGHAAVGNCHFPPNGEKDYDYANPRSVWSYADDWLDYPNLTGKRTLVNCETWGGPDYQRNYLKWWFRRLPNAPGVDATGRQNNWWKYIYRFNDFDERGLVKKR